MIALLQAYCAHAFMNSPGALRNSPTVGAPFGLGSVGTYSRFRHVPRMSTPNDDDEEAKEVNHEDDAMMEIEDEFVEAAIQQAKEDIEVEDVVALEDTLAVEDTGALEDTLAAEDAMTLQDTLTAEDVPLQSAAVEWARAQGANASNVQPKKKYLVIGGGWGGWGAAKALCESGIYADVTLLDALPDPTGTQPYLSKTGKPVEAGTRGFWKDYPNINALCAELGLKEDDVFTPFTNSSFYSPDGLEATAPVFSDAKFPQTDIPFLSQLSGQTFPTLPSPLGQIVATFPLFERIPLEDRASMIGLLLATIDCLGNDESVQEEYDRMSAHDLFVRFQLSKRLVEDFIKPTL